ncbi:MAG TPA: DUF5985 family protein [Verrucomicrobiae bacterium]|nr:DUF5985 family protein [Verrucomicrobiae bacterium]
MASFLSGAIMMGCFVAATFFWRSWMRTNDRLFIWFALSFLILGIERFGIVATNAAETTTPWVYLLRILAFALIAIAIIDKNRR